MSTIELSDVERSVRAILEACLEGHELGLADALTLGEVSGRELEALCSAADELRRAQVGDLSATSSIATSTSRTCASRPANSALFANPPLRAGILLPTDEIVRRALEARELGATEVCLQAGLAPGIDGRLYVELCRALKKAAPELHLHAFSPEEVKYGARLAKLSIRATSRSCATRASAPCRARPPRCSTTRCATGLRPAASPPRNGSTSSAPRTSSVSDHLDADVRARRDFGARLRHLELLRSIQHETGGFTEFVPLSFVHEEAPMYLDQLLPELRGGPGEDVIRLFAIARLMLGKDFKNIQVSWVKEGLRARERLLACGANDLGGTLMNESISTSAGASHGQLATPAVLRALIRRAGREPVERDTWYRPLRRFSADAKADPELGALDQVADAEAMFGSYAKLSQSSLHVSSCDENRNHPTTRTPHATRSHHRLLRLPNLDQLRADPRGRAAGLRLGLDRRSLRFGRGHAARLDRRARPSEFASAPR